MYRVAAWLIFAMAFGLMGQEVRDRPLTTEEILDLQHQAAQAEIDREELANLEREAARAIQANSGTFFRRVYSEDFTGSLSHGQPVNKAEFINAVQTVDAKYEVFNASVGLQARHREQAGPTLQEAGIRPIRITMTVRSTRR
jgi:hypothetical protein